MYRPFSANLCLCLALEGSQLPPVHTRPQRTLGHHPELLPRTITGSVNIHVVAWLS